jgi:hypothetical protein
MSKDETNHAPLTPEEQAREAAELAQLEAECAKLDKEREEAAELEAKRVADEAAAAEQAREAAERERAAAQKARSTSGNKETNRAAKRQAELDSAASFQRLVGAADGALAKIREGWARVLEGIAECEELQASQAVAARVAREHAAANGLHTAATEHGHNTLVAHSWDALASLPAPAVAVPTSYVRQFISEHERHVATQVILNQGTTLVAPHATPAEIHAALLSGVHPSAIQSAKQSVGSLQSESFAAGQQNGVGADGWFGLRPKTEPLK